MEKRSKGLSRVYNLTSVFNAIQGRRHSNTDEQDAMLPSEYMKELLLTTDQRLDQLSKIGQKLNFHGILDHKVNDAFRIIPSVVLFQQFLPGDVYNVTVTVRNATQISRPLRLAKRDHPFFSVEYRGNTRSSMVAPGLAHVYNLRFAPDEKKDYDYLVQFDTDNESFTLPVIAIGPRPNLDFPDHITVPKTAVKIPSSKTIFVRNIGNAPAVFTVYTDQPSFTVDPAKSVIEEEEIVQITVTFVNEKAGDYDGNIFFKYESGEILRTEVQSSAENCTIRLDRNSVRMEETYLGMSRKRILTIYNRSDYIVKFHWMFHEDKQKDEQRREEYRNLFNLVHQMEVVKCVDLVHYNICTPDVHELICKRIYGDELISLMNETFEYKNPCFSIMPMEGEIWPQSSIDVNVLYRAVEVEETYSTAYLEVTGREDRIPLSLCGIGKGPTLKLNVVSIEVGNVYLCSVHYYEVVAGNTGIIDGTLVYKSTPTSFGGTIDVTPTYHEITSEEYKSFSIAFSSNRKGDFVERVDFIVKESLEVLSVHLKGCIVCPTLHFDKTGLDFGTIGLGFTSMQEVIVHNLSLMPVRFNITVQKDGSQPPLTYEEFARASTKPNFPQNPQEFTVVPDEGEVPSHSCHKIRVTYTANQEHHARTKLRVDMWDSDSDPITLPLTFCGMIPELLVKPAEIAIRFCFLNFPYTRTCILVNKSNVDAYFYLVPQKVTDTTAIIYSMSVHQGLLKAKQSKEISITIITRALGHQTARLSMLTMGHDRPTIFTVLLCNGQGPVVSLAPTSLDFGKVEVLQKKTMKFRVISDAPIPAQFNLTLKRNEQAKGKMVSPWHLNPTSGTIDPNKTMEIEATLYLRDVGKYTDQIMVSVINSRSITLTLCCMGTGYSILCEPKIFPCFDMGLLFSHQNMTLPIVMRNLSTRQHQLIWSNTCELHTQRGQAVSPRGAKFKINPFVLEIGPGASTVVNCEIRWDANETVQEDWYLFGQVAGQGKRVLFDKSTFKATFCEPHIIFSKQHLHFRLDMGPYGDNSEDTSEVYVTNKSQLALHVHLSIDRPFHMITKDSELVQKMKFLLPDLGSIKVKVRFVPKLSKQPYSQKYTGVLSLECEEHPTRDKVMCAGSVNFPNLSFTTKDVSISAQLGSNAEMEVILSNYGPVPVIYKFHWQEESIDIKSRRFSDTHDSTVKIMRGSMLAQIYEQNLSNPTTTRTASILHTLVPPTNSPASDVHIQRWKSDIDVSHPTKKISQQEIKKFLLPLIQKYVVNDTELPALECLSGEPLTIDYINQVLEIIPHEGIVLPYSSQYVHFGFHAMEPMRVKLTVACEIVHGPTEIINVVAIADVIRYSVDKREINFGEQLFCETAYTSIALRNHCGIAFHYRVDTLGLYGSEKQPWKQLVVHPQEGVVPALSSVKLNIRYQPLTIGPFSAEFGLEVEHMLPLILRVTGVGLLPQIYLSLPRGPRPQYYSVTLEYLALQYLSMEFSEKSGSNSLNSSDLGPSGQEEQLDAENTAKLLCGDWEMIPSNLPRQPSSTDIEMALERRRAVEFIHANPHVLLDYTKGSKKSAIPYLYTQEYVVDVGYVVIGVVTHYSAVITNYGPCTTEIKMKNINLKNVLAKAGILIHFKRGTVLQTGEVQVLHITCHPPATRYTERHAELMYTVYLEVVDGCNIPVTITGIVTYPFIEVDKKALNFGDVIVGECFMMCLEITNSGYVESHWTASIPTCRKKQDEIPFCMPQENAVCLPGQSDVIKIYFKPCKAGFVERKLHIHVDKGLQEISISLYGEGVERKLNIVEPAIEFLPVVPFTEKQERYFTIENISKCPVEFFFHHLDSSYVQEKRIARILAHYYEVEEILLPPKQLGETMSHRLTTFYANLEKEMINTICAALTDDNKSETSSFIDGVDGMQVSQLLRRNTRRQKKKTCSTASISIIPRTRTHTSDNLERASLHIKPEMVSDMLAVLESPPRIPTDDPDKMEKLLHHYIDCLQKNEYFHATMLDPVREVFEDAKEKSTEFEENTELMTPLKKVFIVFHGAPFTDYQETACRSARALGVPVLSLDDCITQQIALGNNEASAKVRDIIDETYLECIAKYSELRETTVTRARDSHDIPKQMSSVGTKAASPPSSRGKGVAAKIEKKEEFGPEEPLPRFLCLESNSRNVERFDQIPRGDELENMCPAEKYEYKIEAIVLLENLQTTYFGARHKDRASVANSERSPKQKGIDTFLGIEYELLFDVLKERLSKPYFRRGFVVQTLDTIFLQSQDATLSMLLDLIGNVEYTLFVTFLNSMDTYNSKLEQFNEENIRKWMEKAESEIRTIDEMSYEEYEQLPQEEKQTYLETVLPLKRDEALQRKWKYSAQLRKKRRSTWDKNGKGRKSRTGKVRNVDSFKQDTRSETSRGETKKGSGKKQESRDSSKQRPEKTPRGFLQVTTAMHAYASDLSALKRVMDNYDALRKQKLSDDKFHIWYVHSNNPWDKTMYDVITLQMEMNEKAKNALPDKFVEEFDLESRSYSILAPSPTATTELPRYDLFQLVCVSSSKEKLVDTDLVEPSQEAIVDGVHGKLKKRKRKLRSKFDDTHSLSISFIESDANPSVISTITREPPKSRCILQPGEIRKYKIKYHPKEVGIHQQTFKLSIANTVENIYEIKVDGIGDVPRVDTDPKTIFPRVEKTMQSDSSEPTYILDEKIFDFGALLVFVSRKENRSHRRTTQLKFRNISTIDTVLTFQFAEDLPDNFSVHPKRLVIHADDEGLLNVVASVAKLGPHSNRLYVCIQNNPEIQIIQLRSVGTKFELEVDGKYISFDKILLYRKEFRISTIRNRCPVPLLWSIVPEEPAQPQISFSPYSGTVEGWGEKSIEFLYQATKVGTIEKQLMYVKIFLIEDEQDPVFTEVITITGETYDVAVDIMNANPIDLKFVRVNFPTRANFVISNRGHYNIKYIVLFMEDEIVPKKAHDKRLILKESLDIRPASGIVQPKNTVVVQVAVLPKAEITLKECPILKCHLLDTNKDATIVAEFPLTVSLVSYYTRFRLHPYPEMNFGSLGICTKKTMYLNVENVGKFPLQYTILKSTDERLSTRVSSKTEDTKRKEGAVSDGTTKKEKKSPKNDPYSTKLLEPTLKIGPFLVTKNRGNVEASETDTIEIECYPEVVGPQEESITVLVEDSVPEDRNGKTILLSVNTCVPSIDFQDLDSMFQENHVVGYIQDFNCPKGIDGHTVFAREEKCLYFRRVGVLRTLTTCFKLHNRNVIPADVEVFIVHGSLTPKISKLDTFVVDPHKERIPPVSHKSFTVSFTPALIEVYQATLEVTVKLPEQFGDEKFTVKLLGEACVPEVVIIEPVCAKRERALVHFGRALVNEINVNRFAFENVGTIRAKVIVDICDDSSSIFAFSASAQTRELMHTRQINEDWNDRHTVVSLMPGEVAHFDARFSPTEIGRFEGRVRLVIVDNPYENLMIDLEGLAYIETVVVEGLELADIKQSTLSSSSRESTHRIRRNFTKQSLLGSTAGSTVSILSYLTYKLDYRACYINRMSKRTFRIANKSANRCYRFQWTPHPHVVFVPSIGHLKCFAKKEIVATLLTSEPTCHENTRLECILCEIEMSDSMEMDSWDDRQTRVQWEEVHFASARRRTESVNMAKKKIEPTAEPAHVVVQGTTKCIQLLLKAIVSYSMYECDVVEINFNDTLMFQKRECKFHLSNPSDVPTQYLWKLNMDEQYPMRLSEETLPDSPKKRIRHRERSQLSSRSSNGTLFPADEATPDVYKDWLVRLTPRPCTCRPTDLFSSTAGLPERSTDSWLEDDDLPFEIHPERGTLGAHETVECTVVFSPMEVFEYRAYLTCKMENLAANSAELNIPISGRSLLPYCHFDVPESDYVSGGRRDPKLTGPVGYDIQCGVLPENIRVVEFKVVGLGKTHIKRFYMINPTADDYYFAWKDRTQNSVDEVSNFHCAVPEGLVERGKRVELEFTFLAESVGVFEFFWLFTIERYNLESLFLFVAVVREPRVYLLSVHLKMQPTVVGGQVRDSITLMNEEDFQIPFHILEESLYSEGRFQSLTVMPMSGVLAAKSEQILWVEYQPTIVGEFQFPVQCLVKTMKKSYTIFVTATAYEILPSIAYIDLRGQIKQIYHDKENVVDFGKISLKKPVTIKFEIANTGAGTFQYTWDLGMTPALFSQNLYCVMMPHRQGNVTGESRGTSVLTLMAFQKINLQDHVVTLKILKGPLFKMTLRASVRRVSVEFSFSSYDFGPCYVQEINAFPYHVDLNVTNIDSIPTILECIFEDRPHLSVDLGGISEALGPRETVVIPIHFRPREQARYAETLVFAINSTLEKKIKIKGEGIVYKIRLVNPRDKLIDLRNLLVGKHAMKKIQVINEGKGAVELKFDTMENLSGYEQHRQIAHPCGSNRNLEEDEKLTEPANEAKPSKSQEMVLHATDIQLCDILTISPASEVHLRPGKKAEVTVKFKPVRRMKPFVSKVALQSKSTILPLFVIRGSCIGAEFRLNRTYVPFGPVVEGCSNESKLLLMNVGDIGAKFKWCTESLPSDFTIAPTSGYCSPGMDINFIVTFRPVVRNSSLEGTAQIDIENYGSLSMKVMGSCCKLPEPTETVSFATCVRTSQTKSVNITNDSGTCTWNLEPEVIGDYFKATDVINIPPEKTATCTITYSPLVMNTAENCHMGTLLLRLPDGKSPLVYLLTGVSDPPEVAGKIVRQFPAKTKYTESLFVYNWTDTTQRFECNIETMDGEKVSTASSKLILKLDRLYTFNGNAKIDVPAKSQRDYRVVFYSYKESSYQFKITFTNQEREYMFYEIHYKVTKPEVIDSIKMMACVRTRVCHALQLNNTLKDEAIVFTAECRHPYIVLHDMPKTVQPMSTQPLNIEYFPLLASDMTVVKLDIYSEEMGHFPYELWLRANPAVPEKEMHVSAVLGSYSVLSLPIKNHANKHVRFSIEMDNDCFTYPKTFDVPALKEASLDVTYEPHDIQNVTTIVKALSPVAGDFVFSIIGTYSLPKPKGPYSITLNKPMSILFKNIFKETKTFEFVLDAPDMFDIKPHSETLKSKQTCDIQVSLKKVVRKSIEATEEDYPITGKLMILCGDHKLSHLNWIYYLRGILE